MHTIKITPNLLFVYKRQIHQIAESNRIEFFLPELDALFVTRVPDSPTGTRVPAAGLLVPLTRPRTVEFEFHYIPDTGLATRANRSHHYLLPVV